MNREQDVHYDPKTGERIVTERIVDDRPVERIVERPTIIKKRAGVGTWLGGLIVGALLVAGGFALLAREEGSFSAAGTAVDQKVASAEEASRNAAEEAGDAAKSAGESVENATDRAATP